MKKEETKQTRSIIITVEDDRSKEGLARAIKVKLENVDLFDAMGILEATKFQMMGERLGTEDPKEKFNYVG